MAEEKSKIKDHYRVIAVKVLAMRAEIDYQKVYNTLALKEPLYNTMSDIEKTKLANALFKDVSKVFKELGTEIAIKRKA
jgi:hypothetical protein